ncbi:MULTISPECIES: rhomboid-like protein [unclassified Streptomyces]|uniref:rhomboid-like protein n=1 Tax=unclassified Streptomyces TaxID=2593676 RepID=UPI003D765239
MERTAPADPTTGLLDGMPRQPTRVGPAEAPKPVPDAAAEAAPEPAGIHRRAPWRRIPVPFTLGYTAVLCATSYLADHADPGLVAALHEGSSTDVAHLLRSPVPVLLASALWVAGGLGSPFTLAFLVVLTALELRVGALRTAGVFLLGHTLATLVTEVPVGFAVLAGHLPGTSLHRLDYGISYGVATCLGALAGLLRPWLGLPLLAVAAGFLVDDLLALTDPLTNWGHLTALTLGVATWPLLRRAGRGDTDAERHATG